LIDPEVERALDDWHAEPVGIQPGSRPSVVVEALEFLDDAVPNGILADNALVESGPPSVIESALLGEDL
jgi:hypothetical protein